MSSGLPILQKRRVSSAAKDRALRLFGHAARMAERLGEALTLVEQTWARRQELARALGRRSARERPVEAPATTASSENDPDTLRRGSPPPPPPEETAHALALLLARHLAVTVQTHARRLECDPWAVGADHCKRVRQVRIATRRLRTFIDLFRSDLPPKTARKARRSLRKLGRALGPLRELDVHVEQLEAHRLRAPSAEERMAIEYALERIERRRARAEARARKAWAEDDRECVQVELRELTDRIVGPLVREEDAAAAWVARALGDFLRPRLETLEVANEQPLSFEQLHERRITIKRMRYALELLGPAFDDAKLVKRMKAVQRRLGQHRDLTLMHELLEDLHDALRTRRREALANALTIVMKRIDAEHGTAHAGIPTVRLELETLRSEVHAKWCAESR